jgi:hypothetical protein
MRIQPKGLWAAGLPLAALLAGCSSSNNLLLGRVQARVSGHMVVVTDCYRTSVPPPRKMEEEGRIAWRFTPCRDAEVLIRDEELVVNGQSYGRLRPADSVLVDHGVVKINARD